MHPKLRVVVTRPEGERDSLSDRLIELGCEVLAAPGIEIGPPKSFEELDRLVRNPASCDWILFMSRNSVRYFVQRYRRLRRRVPSDVGNVSIGVVGAATADIARRAELPVTLVSSGRTGADLAGEVAKQAAPGAAIAIVQAQDGGQDASELLEALGFSVRSIAAYRTRSAKVPGPIVHALMNGEVNALAFASPSSVLTFAIALGGFRNLHPNVRVGAIGPTTASACERAGRKPEVIPSVATGVALADALLISMNGRHSDLPTRDN